MQNLKIMKKGYSFLKKGLPYHPVTRMKKCMQTIVEVIAISSSDEDEEMYKSSSDEDEEMDISSSDEEMDIPPKAPTSKLVLGDDDDKRKGFHI